MSNALSRDLAKLIAGTERAASVEGRWRQRVHLMPPTGWLNDPNGLCQVGDTFNAYFQYAPFDAEGGVKMWGHCVSNDLVSWQYVGTPLMPDQPFDCHGVYSGSAVVEGEHVAVLYTGNVKLEDGTFDYVNTGREANTVLVESSDGGRTFGAKHLVMTNADYPAGLTCHVRDPKVWREGDRYLMVQGARRRTPAEVPSTSSRYCALHGERAGVDVGEVLVFSSPDLAHWEFVKAVSSPERFGFMWECPDYFELPQLPATGARVVSGAQATADARDSARAKNGAGVAVHAATCAQAAAGVHVLSVSPQGLEGGAWDRRNIYESGYFLLDAPLLEASAPDPAQFHLWDAGFDFYAPQTFEASDGRRILIGWMGMPDEPAHVNKTLADGWQHCFTIPREVTFDGEVLRQRPVRELDAHRTNAERAAWTVERQGSEAFDLVVDGVGTEVLVRLAGELEIAWSERSGELELRFTRTDRAGVGGGRTVRHEPLADLRDLRVIGDASSVEVFANAGELVLSTRYYPDEYTLSVDAPGAELRLWDLA